MQKYYIMSKKHSEKENNKAREEMVQERQVGLQEEDRFNILTDFFEAEQEYMEQENQSNDILRRAVGELMEICAVECANISQVDRCIK